MKKNVGNMERVVPIIAGAVVLFLRGVRGPLCDRLPFGRQGSVRGQDRTLATARIQPSRLFL